MGGLPVAVIGLGVTIALVEQERIGIRVASCDVEAEAARLGPRGARMVPHQLGEGLCLTRSGPQDRDHDVDAALAVIRGARRSAHAAV